MRSVPIAPLALGLAGLLPFWAVALGLASQSAFGLQALDLDRALATYAAIIISFLGGIRWGLTSASVDQNTTLFALSVVPSLLAWSLLLAPEPWRLLALGTMALVLVRSTLSSSVRDWRPDG